MLLLLTSLIHGLEPSLEEVFPDVVAPLAEGNFLRCASAESSSIQVSWVMDAKAQEGKSGEGPTIDSTISCDTKGFASQ